MPKPVCVECEIEFKPYKNGIMVAEMFQKNKIYKIWSADEWECPICHKKIVYGFGSSPVCEHFEIDKVAELKKDIDVRDFETIDDALSYSEKHV